MKRISPTVVEIDLRALRHNYRRLTRKVPKTTVKILSVVKSNAYGHGAPRIAQVLQEEGTDWFGVGTVDEGIELREAGIKKPILLLLGLVRNHADLLIRHQLTPVLYDLETARQLNEGLAERKRRLPVHLKVDTGMTRLGVLLHEMRSFCQGLGKFSSLEPVGLLTHLADAGEEGFTRRQRDLFEKARREFNSHFQGRHLYHELNSQAVIEGLASGKSPAEQIGGMVRLGIALYGAYPSEKNRRLIDLKPVLRWKTKIVSIKKVSSKTPVSYGRTFHTKRESRIGVLPVGYADGYLRILSNRSSVLVRGKKVPVVGRVCMDMTMIDLTSVPSAQTGDEVVLIGKQGQSEIRAEELASKSETISYEIFCRIAERIQRVYL